MPKMKSIKAAKKRFKLLKSGKIKRTRANRRHILTKRNQDRKRALRKGLVVHHSDENRTRRMLEC